MRVSKRVRLTLAAGAVLVFGAACAEPTSAPTASNVTAEEAPLSFGTYAVDGSILPDSGSYKFYWDPTRAYAGPMGENYLKLPAYVVCDPATSGYGIGKWDAPCAVATKPFPMTVSWKNRDGKAIITFAPDLRFVPTSDPAKMVYLTMKYRGAWKDFEPMNIVWKGPDGRWYDESRVDASLRPVVSKQHNTVSRRLKHFSGYSITAGFYETDSQGAILGLGW